VDAPVQQTVLFQPSSVTPRHTGYFSNVEADVSTTEFPFCGACHLPQEINDKSSLVGDFSLHPYLHTFFKVSTKV
jgi:hypothetical protein